MGTKIVMKVNDARGAGHICRVINFVDYATFLNDLVLIVHPKFYEKIPERVPSILVFDEGYRVDLDRGNIYEKWKNRHRSDVSLETAVEKYYLSMLDPVDEETRLVYVDDHNGPENLFPKEVARCIGLDSPDILDLAPSAKLAYQIETQFWHSSGEDSMSQTLRRALERADYLHLSTDPEFLSAVIGTVDFAGQNHKVLTMGFPLSQAKREIIASTNNGRKREVLDGLFAKYRIAASRKLIYCTFGAGNGAEDAIGTLAEVASQFPKDYVFVIANPANKNSYEAEQRGYDVQPTSTNNREAKKIELGRGKALYFIKHKTQAQHLELLAAADVLVQGNGSSTVYESIASGTPTVNIPLYRPAYEQILGGIGLAMYGAGELLLLPDVAPGFERLKPNLTKEARRVKTLPFNPASLIEALQTILANYAAYEEGARSLQGYFGDSQTIANTVKDMAAGLDPFKIISRRRLKTYG